WQSGADGSRTHDLLNAIHSLAVATVRDRARLCVKIEHSRRSPRPSGIDAKGKTIAEPPHGASPFPTPAPAPSTRGAFESPVRRTGLGPTSSLVLSRLKRAAGGHSAAQRTCLMADRPASSQGYLRFQRSR